MAWPPGLARIVEFTIEIVAGTPDIVSALFGPVDSPARLVRAAVVALKVMVVDRGRRDDVADRVPPLFAATRDGLQAVPEQMREAAFALGKTRIATIRRVLLLSVRSNIATGATLGQRHHRRHRDRAVGARRRRRT